MTMLLRVLSVAEIMKNVTYTEGHLIFTRVDYQLHTTIRSLKSERSKNSTFNNYVKPTKMKGI